MLEELPVYKTLLEQFTNNELIDKATLDKQYEKELREGTGVFDANTEMGRKHWQDLRYETNQHQGQRGSHCVDKMTNCNRHLTLFAL